MAAPALFKTNTNDPKYAGQHLFQVRGLGKPPYSVAMVRDRGDLESFCDYCGTSIRYEYWLDSSDDQHFKVGSDCIHLTFDEGLIHLHNIHPDLLKIKAAQKKAKEEKALKDVQDLLEKHLDDLKLYPHPISYHAARGKSMWDEVNGMLKTGKSESHLKKVAKLIQETLKNPPQPKPEPEKPKFQTKNGDLHKPLQLLVRRYKAPHPTEPTEPYTTYMLACFYEGETEKAYRFTTSTGETFWLPKKAVGRDEAGPYKGKRSVATWYTWDDNTWNKLAKSLTPLGQGTYFNHYI